MLHGDGVHVSLSENHLPELSVGELRDLSTTRICRVSDVRVDSFASWVRVVVIKRVKQWEFRKGVERMKCISQESWIRARAPGTESAVQGKSEKWQSVTGAGDLARAQGARHKIAHKCRGTPLQRGTASKSEALEGTKRSAATGRQENLNTLNEALVALAKKIAWANAYRSVSKDGTTKSCRQAKMWVVRPGYGKSSLGFGPKNTRTSVAKGGFQTCRITNSLREAKVSKCVGMLHLELLPQDISFLRFKGAQILTSNIPSPAAARIQTFSASRESNSAALSNNKERKAIGLGCSVDGRGRKMGAVTL
ncbi:hypothetical protein FB45DRAFT_861232 [Roridomyces roridus]|uniref:Uncharacterized protein n=1 Tax=Roridomyces roridus TaxID=1738132 RepID=A0AAD7FWP1_9AGAR|nr:hypothetical protein FB45DRAFT_861232 [Roridomyces roridus]